MRSILWPDHQGHSKDTNSYFEGNSKQVITLVAENQRNQLVGFAEVGSRDYAEGCTSSPVAYLEGWYVDEKVRRSGIGLELVQAAEKWAREQGFSELASDCRLDNPISAQAHESCGFSETDRMICFKKQL